MQNETSTNSTFNVNAKPKGLLRLYLAVKNSARAIKWLIKNESAFRQEALALLIAIPVTFVIDASPTEQLILIATVLFVMLVEIINTAIEVVVDRIGVELNPLSGLAKDLGSAAVSISLVLAALTWIGICFL
nr:diacylglycerol kinase [uncultured Glaciecola sp.]